MTKNEAYANYMSTLKASEKEELKKVSIEYNLTIKDRSVIYDWYSKEVDRVLGTKDVSSLAEYAKWLVCTGNFVCEKDAVNGDLYRSGEEA